MLLEATFFLKLRIQLEMHLSSARLNRIAFSIFHDAAEEKRTYFFQFFYECIFADKVMSPIRRHEIFSSVTTGFKNKSARSCVQQELIKLVYATKYLERRIE